MFLPVKSAWAIVIPLAGSIADVMIIGGGIPGLATAVECALRGAQVTLLERTQCARAASWAAAGMLAPQAEGLPPGPLLDLALRSLNLYPLWVTKLESLSGLDAGYWPCGILAPVFADHLPHQHPPSWLSAAAIQQLQPGLSPQVAAGQWFPAEGQVDNRLLSAVLLAAAQQLKVRIHEGVEVQPLRLEQGQIRRLQTTAGEFQAGCYVLAAGAWSGGLLDLPITPRKGQMLALQAPEAPALRQVLFGEQVYLVPRRDGRILVGATNEAVGFTPGNTASGIQSLLAAALKLWPSLAEQTILELWWGFRPTTPDQAPILGQSPYRNLVLATGHYRNGILLAPITAQLIADWIQGQTPEPLLSAFRWDRF